MGSGLARGCWAWGLLPGGRSGAKIAVGMGAGGEGRDCLTIRLAPGRPSAAGSWPAAGRCAGSTETCYKATNRGAAKRVVTWRSSRRRNYRDMRHGEKFDQFFRAFAAKSGPWLE